MSTTESEPQSGGPRPPSLNFAREQLDVVLKIFDDVRMLIAAIKVLRWDVVKWAVTINIGLAAASAGFEKAHWAFFICATVICGFGIGLVYFWNFRLTQARARLPLIHKFWRENVIDLKTAAGLDYGASKGRDWDKAEVKVYVFIIACSIVPAFLVWVVE